MSPPAERDTTNVDRTTVKYYGSKLGNIVVAVIYPLGLLP